MKIILKAIITLLTIPAILIIGCGNNQSSTATLVAQDSVAPKILSEHGVKVSPPVSLKVVYEPNDGANAVPVRVEVIPAENMEDMQIEWTLPEGVGLTSGESKKKVTGAKLAKGAKNELEYSLKGSGKPSDPAVVTVRVLLNGEWFGTAKGVQIGPSKPQPKQKIAPGGYIETPMIKIKN